MCQLLQLQSGVPGQVNLNPYLNMFTDIIHVITVNIKSQNVRNFSFDFLVVHVFDLTLNGESPSIWYGSKFSPVLWVFKQRANTLRTGFDSG